MTKFLDAEDGKYLLRKSIISKSPCKFMLGNADTDSRNAVEGQHVLFSDFASVLYSVFNNCEVI